MAASLVNRLSTNFWRIRACQSLSVARYLTPQALPLKYQYHSDAGQKQSKIKSGIAVTDDGSAIICWHPEQPFPYEYTQPMPRDEEELARVHSPVNVNLQRADKYRFTPNGPTDRQLKEIFFTTKHAWFPRPRSRRRKPNPPKDRQSI